MAANIGNFDSQFNVNIIALNCTELAKFNEAILHGKLTTDQKVKLADILQKAWKGGSGNSSLQIEDIYEQMVTRKAVVITESNIQYGSKTLSKVDAQMRKFLEEGTIEEARPVSPALSESTSPEQQRMKQVRNAIGDMAKRSHEPASKTPLEAITQTRQAEDSPRIRETRPFVLPQSGPAEYPNWKITERTHSRHLTPDSDSPKHRTQDIKNYPHAVSLVHASERIPPTRESPFTRTPPEKTLRIVTGANAGVAGPLLNTSHEEGVRTVGVTRVDAKTKQPKPAAGYTDILAGGDCLAGDPAKRDKAAIEAHEASLDAMAQQILDGIPQDATIEEIQIVNNVGMYYFDQELTEVKNEQQLNSLLQDPINKKLDTFKPEKGQESPPTLAQVNERIKANKKNLKATNIVYERNLQKLTEKVRLGLEKRSKEGGSAQPIRLVPVILGSAQRKDDARSRNKEFARIKDECAQCWMRNPNVHCVVQVNTGLIDTPGARNQWGTSQPHWLSTGEVANTVIGALEQSHGFTFLEVDTFRPQPSEQLATFAKGELERRHERWSI